MVLRIKKKSRKYLGSRRWGAGNIKNNRGAGDRGGVGRGGRKHKMTRLLVYERDTLKKKGKGFYRYKRKTERLIEVNLRQIERMLKANANKKEGGEGKPVLDLVGYKVLGSGNLSAPAVIRANSFSKGAIKKIEQAGGEAIKVDSKTLQGTQLQTSAHTESQSQQRG